MVCKRAKAKNRYTYAFWPFIGTNREKGFLAIPLTSARQIVPVVG